MKTLHNVLQNKSIILIDFSGVSSNNLTVLLINSNKRYFFFSLFIKSAEFNLLKLKH